MSAPLIRVATPALLLAALVVAGPVSATTAKPPPKLTLESLPAAVQKTVRAETAGGTVNAIIKEQDPSGNWVYEIESKVKGLGYDFIVGGNGALLIGEHQVTMESLPPAVRSTLVKAAGKRQILIVESVTKSGKLEFYEAQVAPAKAPVEIKVGLDGTLMK